MKKLLTLLLLAMFLTGCSNVASLEVLRNEKIKEAQQCLDKGKHPLWYYYEDPGIKQYGIVCLEPTQQTP